MKYPRKSWERGGCEAREPLLPPAGGGQIFKDDMIGFPQPLIFSSWSGYIRIYYAKKCIK
jgi:hypothetical protein